MPKDVTEDDGVADVVEEDDGVRDRVEDDECVIEGEAV